jgi:hypothetical protein
MKHLFILALLSLATVTAYAQKTKDTVSEVAVAAPTFSIIYEVTDDAGEPLGALELQVYDRKLQTEGIQFKRLNDQVRGLDPIRPKVKLIHLPEVGGLAYKLAESLEEIRQPVDGVTVLLVDYMLLLEAKRTKYN